MPAYTLTEDIVAICLILTEGNTDLTIEEVLDKIGVFQEKHNRHFGISRRDMHGLFYSLIKYDLALEKELDKVFFWEIIPEVLKYQNGYFNDEGEFFELREDKCSRFRALRSLLWNQLFHNYSINELKEKIRNKQKLVQFFRKQRHNNPQSILGFLKLLNYSQEVLFHCSREGEWS